MRILGLDLGKKRIGLAVSDENGSIAFPAGILESRGRKRDLAALCKMIEERTIGAAVVGLPLHMDGRRGPEAEKALAFASALATAAGIPVATLDERWTSMEAERVLEASPKRRRAENRSKGTVDEMAASIILRTYLEMESRGEVETESRGEVETESRGASNSDGESRSGEPGRAARAREGAET